MREFARYLVKWHNLTTIMRQDSALDFVAVELFQPQMGKFT